jgi:methionine-rich copper-binding protein CopC
MTSHPSSPRGSGSRSSSPSPSRWRGGRGPRWLPALLFASFLALVLTLPVEAHSRPLRFDPAPGAVLTAPPTTVQGWFTSTIRRDPNWSFLRVTNAQGQRVDTGETNLSSDRLQMSVNLTPNLAPGRYMVTWRTFDDGDGEIFGDCYIFFVGQEAADQALRDRIRLDGGSACERIEFSANAGTPTPQQVQAQNQAGGGSGGMDDHGEAGDGGVPVWVLALGIVGGAIMGGLGGRYLARA